MSTQTPPRRTLGTVLGNVAQDKSVVNNASHWSELCSRIKEGMIIPIIGNSLIDERIFRPLFDKLFASNNSDNNSEESEHIEIEETLASQWAVELNYPLADHGSLARVTQFCQVKRADEAHARRTYLTFLKKTLLDVLERIDSRRADAIADLRRQSHERNFSAIASDLSLPHGLAADDDPLRLLARLNLPIYVTTSYFDFLERAIEAEGRKPVTQICGDISNLADAHRINRDFQPSAQTPVVYHLHGLEDYPGSLVLSEDDYLRFLVRITQPIDPEKPTIPLYLGEKLAESTLILLGYRLQDWDFRTTFRGLINNKDTTRRSFSLAIQLDPAQLGDIHDPKEAQDYLAKYFDKAKFQVEWGTPEEFARKMWREWDRWRQGER